MFDSIFLIPALNGLCLALLLPMLGCYLRLRNEWLAAIAYPHVAAAGTLGALAIGAPLIAGGIFAASLAALLKRRLARQWQQNTVYALLLLIGWAASILLTSNLPMAERLGHALFDGQLYFTGAEHLGALLAGLIVGFWMLHRWSQRLLLAQIFPHLLPARRNSKWALTAGFDLLTAGILALATLTLGVMGCFSLIFVPAWAAFHIAGNWRRALVTALVLGVVSYAFAFMLALQFDQAFGPSLALASIMCCIGTLSLRRDCAMTGNMIKS